MRFPSLRSLAEQAGAAALRFPLPLLCAAAATGCALWSIDSTRAEELPIRGLQTALLGLPLLLAVALLHERSGGDPRSRRWRVLVLAGALAALGAYFLAWPGWTWVGSWTRFLHLALACHLLVAFLPFVGPGQLHSFWTFNRALLLRFLLTTLFAAVLFAGIALAILGLDQLFELDGDIEVFMRLFVIAAALFHPWHFLAGVPSVTRPASSEPDLPAALRVLAQFLLVPLVAVYLLILNAYVARLLVMQHWPVRFLGYLVAAVAIAGILALLLLYPLRVRAEYRWVDVFELVFHALVLPPAIVLLIAIGRRVDAYGLTEPRYLLAMLVLWLIGLSLFQLATRSRNIKLIPISLALLALLTFGGPWSAYAASRWEQRQRLESVLEDAAMLDGDRARRPAAAPLDFATRRALSGTVTYLLNAHGVEALAPWLDAAASARELALKKGASIEPLARRVLEDLGVDYVDRFTTETVASLEILNRLASPDATPIDVSSFSWALRFALVAKSPASFSVGDETWTLESAAPEPRLLLRSGSGTRAVIDLAPLLDRLRAESASRQGGSSRRVHLIVPFESERVRGIVVFEQIYGAFEDGTLRLDQLMGELFFELDAIAATSGVGPEAAERR